MNNKVRVGVLGAFRGGEMIKYCKDAENAELVAYIEEQIELRKAAKKAKDFAEADRIRNELAEKGIILKDTRDGTTYTINA